MMKTPHDLRPAMTALIVALGIGAGSPAFAQQLDISVDEDNRISLAANDVPLARIAAALAERTGVAIELGGDSDPRITLEIVDESLEGVVAALSPSYLLKRRSNQPDAAILEIVLLTDDSAAGDGDGSDQFLPTGEPAAETDLPENLSTDGSVADELRRLSESVSDEAENAGDSLDGTGGFSTGWDDGADSPASFGAQGADQFADQPDVPDSEPRPFTPDQLDQ